MKTRLRIFLQTTLIIFTIEMTGRTQPMPIDFPAGSANFASVGEPLYFTVGENLWRSDGTEGGTILVKSAFNSTTSSFIEFNGLAIWLEGGSLWRSDGTPSGTFPLTTSSQSNIGIVDTTENYLFFHATDASVGLELFRTDGTVAGTLLLKDVNQGGADGYQDASTVVGSDLFFSADDGTHGSELWKTDGTPEGTAMVKDINTGSANGFTGPSGSAIENELLFSANDGVHGSQVWRSDGTESGTSIVGEIDQGPDDLSAGFAVDHYFYFSKTGSDLWVTNTIESTTEFLKDIPGFNIIAGVDGKLIFYGVIDTGEGNQIEIWKSEGTPASTIKLSSLCVDCQFDGHRFLTYNDKVYFVVKDAGGLTHYIWKTDGTEAGTEIVFSEFLDGSIPFFEIVNGFLFFYTTSQGNNLALHVFDAEDGQATARRSFKQGPSQRQVTTAAVGNFVFFADHDGPSDQGSALNPEDAFQLFQTDGVTIISLRDMFGTSFQNTNEIIDHNGKALFSTQNPIQWWIYDPGSPGKAGEIQQEIWTGVTGTTISSIPVNSQPSSVSNLTIFETPVDIDDNYGSRVRGYVMVPETGDYTFWISSDDRGELWLSTDEDPANKTKIAEVTTWTNSRQWDKYPSQKSVHQRLLAGRKYYIEALLKEATGRDHLAVGWQLPNGTLERPIPRERLMTLQAPENLPKIAITNPRDGRTFTPPANVSITTATEGNVSKVEFYHGTVKLGEDTTYPFAFTWNNVPEGNYTLLVKAMDGHGHTSTDQLNFFVTEGSPCSGAGIIRQEFWVDVPGTRVSAIPLDREPDFVHDLPDFSGPVTDMGDNYGSRIRGYICPPTSGQYTFWISGDDNVELWLSTDGNPENKKRIAYHTGWTNRNEWTKYPSQQSVAITLSANQKYYVEALMKEGSGGDHVSVSWNLQGGFQQTIIRGNYLIPFESSEPPTACSGTGTILVETWSGIDGARVASIPVDSPPDLTGERTIFEAPTNVGSNFGSRFRGYLCVPITGNYTFWIASDDHSELWLSTDDDPVNKRLIANVWGWTTPRQWTKYTSQQSAPINLVAGQQYYIEALYKEDEGGDNMAVGWQLPDGTLERPIPGNRLSPFADTGTMMLAGTTTQENAAMYSHISVYPNPARSGDPELTIAGYEGIEETIETQVEIINMTGEVIFEERISCGGNCGSYLMNLNKQLVPGIYMVNMRTNGVRASKRLLVN